MTDITNNEIVSDALREIGVLAETEDASPEQGAQTIRKLNGLMATWEGKGIRVGYFEQTSSAGVCPIPNYARDAVVLNLAIRSAPQYGKTVSIELATAADDAYKILSQQSVQSELQNLDMTHMPEGSGYQRNRWNINSDR